MLSVNRMDTISTPARSKTVFKLQLKGSKEGFNNIQWQFDRKKPFGVPSQVLFTQMLLNSFGKLSCQSKIYPPKIMKNFRQKNRKQANQDTIKVQNKEYSNKLSALERYNRQSALRQAEARFSLQSLAIMVKIYLERHGTAFIDTLYNDVLGKYLQRMGLNKRETEELLISIRRRICEVMRVLNGLGAINLEKKIVSLTPMGKLKGRGLLKKFKKRQAQYEEKRQYLKKKVQEKKKLETMLQSFYLLQERNQKILSQQSSKDCQDRVFKMPLTVIAGQPCTLFQPEGQDFRSVEINPVTGNIDIKGRNMRIIPIRNFLPVITKSK